MKDVPQSKDPTRTHASCICLRRRLTYDTAGVPKGIEYYCVWAKHNRPSLMLTDGVIENTAERGCYNHLREHETPF